MKSNWSELVRIKTLETNWDKFPTTAGIYIIRCGKDIHRAGGLDRNGILYIGKSLKLRNRLWQFWYLNHPASWFIWKNPKIAKTMLGKNYSNKKNIEIQLGELFLNTASPISSKVLSAAERAVLYAYAYKFGELPPLNSSLPDRWAERASSEADLKWALKGICTGRHAEGL